MEEEKVRIKLHKEYLSSEIKEMKQKRRKKLLIVLLCFFMLIIGLVGGFVATSLVRGLSVTAFKQSKFDKITSFFDSIWLYKNDYDDLESTMEEKAFYGMTNFANDKYSTYMSADEVRSFTEGINMNYVGIGAQYSYINNVATITRVFKDSPAEKGGLMVGDIIETIEGESIEGLTSDEIKAKIVGDSGTKVKVTVKRAGISEELTFIRGAIDSTVYASTINDVVLLEIMSFGETTADECVKYLDQYIGYSKIIIDLRDNTGGYQTSVQEVAGLFLGEGVVVLNETDNTGTTKSYKTTADKYYDNFKNVIILTNESTASAAEVLTIALKEEHSNAIQVGVTTYGKGVVQSSYYLEDGSALKITTSYWTSPNGVSINNVGVKPDVEVKLDDILYKTAYMMSENDTYKYDDVSDFISIAEGSLKFLDYDVDRVDGYFDISFAKALEAFKADNNLEVNDILDFETYNAIISSVVREYYYNTDKDAQLVKALELLGE